MKKKPAVVVLSSKLLKNELTHVATAEINAIDHVMKLMVVSSIKIAHQLFECSYAATTHKIDLTNLLYLLEAIF